MPSVVVIAGVEAVKDRALVRLVTLIFGVELVKVTTAPAAAPLAQPVEVPEVKVPPAASLKALVAFTLAAVVPLAMLAKALACWAAVAPALPAVKVSPSMVKVWPGAKGLNVTAAVSVVPGAAPSTVTMPGAEVPCAKALLKLTTLVLAVVLVKVSPAPEAAPLVQPLGAPAVNVPPVAALRPVFKVAKVELAKMP